MDNSGVRFSVDLPYVGVNTPETALLRAVLEDCISLYFRYRPLRRSSRRSARIYDENLKWIYSEDIDRLCTFVNICHLLGVEPDYLRREIENASTERELSVSQPFFRRTQP